MVYLLGTVVICGVLGPSQNKSEPIFFMMSVIHVGSLGFWTTIKVHCTDYFAMVGCTDSIC